MNARQSRKLDRPSAAAGPARWPEGDPADELLGRLRLSGVVYCRSELSAPWGLSMPAMPGCMSFHLVMQGRCLLTEADGSEHDLQAGDVMLVTRGDGHSLRSQAGVAAPDLFSLPRRGSSPWYEQLRHGGAGPLTLLLCGAVRFDDSVSRRLIGALPNVVLLRAQDSGDNDWLTLALRRVADEAARPGPGAEVLMTRLADVVVVLVLRDWLARQPPRQQGWVAALQDRHVGRALQRLHADTGRDWTLADLARASGLSRSALAERFQRLVGCSPMAYLAEVRLLKGRDLLRTDSLSIGEVAGRCGYGSEAAFSRAFKRLTGLTPGAARRAGAEPPFTGPDR